MLNAITHVWRPQEVPPSIVRAIYRNALDGRNGSGTGTQATKKIVDEINAIVAARQRGTRFRCGARCLSGHQVTVAPNGLIARTIRSGGSAVVDVRCGDGKHAMTLLGVDSEHWTFFDPYLHHRHRHPRRRRGIEWLGHPGIAHAPNLRITRRYLDMRRNVLYAVGPVAEREAVILMPR
jgi:hypothetical protein